MCYASPQRAIATTAVAELLGRKLWWHPVKGRRPLDREAQRITPEASSHCEPTSGGPCAPVRAARFWILYAPFFRASANQFSARGSSTDRSEPSDLVPPTPPEPDLTTSDLDLPLPSPRHSLRVMASRHLRDCVPCQWRCESMGSQLTRGPLPRGAPPAGPLPAEAEAAEEAAGRARKAPRDRRRL